MLDVAVGRRGGDVDGGLCVHEGLALKSSANDVDDALGQVREVAQGLVLDLAVFAVGTAKQVGAVDLVLVLARRRDDVGSSETRWHTNQYRQYAVYVN